MTARASRWFAALTGVVAALVVLAVAEAVSLLVGPAGSPLFAVGSLVIDLVPPGVKELVISLFGTGDKAVLLTVLGVLVGVLAAAAGVVEARRSPWGVVMFGAAGLLAVIAVLTRAGATGFDGAPSIVGAVAGIVVLRIGIERLARWGAAAATRPSGARPTGRQVERRGFLTLTIVAGAASLIVGAGARAMNAGSAVVTQVRNALVLPKPAVAAPAVPSGADLHIAGLAPIVTPNADFYRIDTALQVPSIDSGTWKLAVTGMVENEIEIDFAQLLAKPLTEHMITLACVSNDVGGTLIGTALWLGYPIRDLLTLAVPKAGADMVLSSSVDGFTAGTPLDVLQDENTQALLAVGMNGKPLPLEHGFPVRMVVPGLYGYVSATKWVVRLEVTRFADAQGYWTPRGWSARGPIKLSSRIDTPVDGSRVAVGEVAIAGVAWAQHIGVQRVEVQVDGGPWAEARLADSISADTWRQWVYRWTATKGNHTVRVRATDANGVTQRGSYVPPAPDGAEGWHEISVSV
jgi:DMSO/TMAO reductase YedYZ molybdopterin-dependent catalytic subunit